MDRIFACILEAEEREGIKSYYGKKDWAKAARDQDVNMFENLRSQPYSPQRVAVEQLALSAAIENGIPQYVENMIKQISSSPDAAATLTSAICIAAKHGNIAILKLVLDQGASVEEMDWDGNTALTLAATAGHETVVELLLDRGAYINSPNRDLSTALMLAATAGHKTVVELLLDRGADINSPNQDLNTALMLAAIAGHKAVVKLLLHRGAEINETDWGHNTSLMLAATAGHETVVELLLDRGADINETDRGNKTALTLAATAGHEAVVKLLRDREADIKETRDTDDIQKKLISSEQSLSFSTKGAVNSKDSSMNQASTAGFGTLFSNRLRESKLHYSSKLPNESGLMEAAKPGRESGVSSLLEESRLHYSSIQSKKSALIEAAKHGHEAVVSTLLNESELGYHRSKPSKEIALIEAAKNGHEAVVSTLLENSELGYHGSKPMMENALIEAAKNGHEKVVTTLLSSSLWSYIDQRHIPQVLFMAMQNHHCRVVDAVLGYRALKILDFDVNSFDDFGKTLLHWAVENGDEKNVLLLIEAGSSVAFLDNYGMSPLQLAAVNGVSPPELDAARKHLAEKNSHPDTSRSLYAKMELGLGFGDSYLAIASRIVQSASDIHNSSTYDGDGSLYYFVLLEIARSLGFVAPFDVLSNPTYISTLPSWGRSLIGGHIRFTVGPNISIIIRIDRLLGFGSEVDGIRFLEALIALEESVNGETNRFRLRQTMKASNPKYHTSLRSHQLLIWLVALAHRASKHQAERASAIQNREGRPILAGSCWRDAFGDVLEVDLYGHVDSLNPGSLNSTIRPEDRDHQTSFYSSLTFSTTEDLASAMGVYSEATLDDTLFWKGSGGTCVLIGVLPHKNIPFWHVCTIEQSSYLEADPESFVRSIKSSRDLILEVNSRLEQLHECEKITSLQNIVLVGALVEPGWCDKLRCQGLFQAQGDKIQAGRLHVDTRGSGLQWSNISGQVQLSMGAQGPQGSVNLGGELVRNTGQDLLMAETSLAHSLTVLERALRSWVLVYQSSNGQVVQQNLYCIVSCFITNEKPDIATQQESFAEIGSAQEWRDGRITLTRVCSTIIAAPMPAFLNGKIGGLDLAAIVKECMRIWVWELPSEPPSWVPVLGGLPAVSVQSLNVTPNLTSLQRCTLLISVGRLEQIVGRLIEVDSCQYTFASGLVRVQLRGFNEASLREAQGAAETAKKLRWTNSMKLVTPGRRFGGQGPSLMVQLAPIKIWDYVVVVVNRARNGIQTASTVHNSNTLGNLANGTELTGDCVGLLIECI